MGIRSAHPQIGHILCCIFSRAEGNRNLDVEARIIALERTSGRRP
jgi:hypothetical protein